MTTTPEPVEDGSEAVTTQRAYPARRHHVTWSKRKGHIMSADVLIIEDAADLAELIARSLAKRGIETRLAETGKAAMRLIDQRRPQVILLDIHLPDMDGWQVLDYARRQFDDFSARVIVISSSDEEQDRRRSQQYGVDHYFVKPFQRETLSQAVEEILNLG